MIAADLGWDDIAPGRVFEIQRSFSAEDVDLFATISGDRSPLHVDENYAAGTEFGRRIVHGMLLASLFSALVGMHIPGRPALYVGQDIVFRKPVFIGDRLTASAKVISKTAATGMITLAMEIRNGEGQIVVNGIGRVKLRGKMAVPGTDCRTAPTIKEQLRPVAVVTGGSRGLGAEIAVSLARAGYSVIAVHRAARGPADALRSAMRAEGHPFVVLELDITKDGAANAVMAAADGLGPLAVLVNSAIGPLDPAPAQSLEWGGFAAHLDTQARAVFELSCAAMPRMREAGGGSIINIASQVVIGMPPRDLAHYVTAKYALLGLSRALAIEWAPSGIRVNVISPGMAQTDLTMHQSDRIFRAETMRTPLGRLVMPTDVARVAAFLAGDGGAFITGVNIPLTGGQAV